MAEVRDMLKQIRSGEVTAEEVADDIAAAVLGSPSIVDSPSDSESMWMSMMVDKDYTNSWFEVSEARDSKTITPEQYEVLLEAYSKANASGRAADGEGFS